ncbi:hypothetical protein AAVH_30676, partial [Aphelenchoides avenae]
SRQRISDLATQLHRKDTDLQQELTKVAAYTKTVKDLRDTVHSLRDELRKHGIRQQNDDRHKQFQIFCCSVVHAGCFNKYTKAV